MANMGSHWGAQMVPPFGTTSAYNTFVHGATHATSPELHRPPKVHVVDLLSSVTLFGGAPRLLNSAVHALT